LLIIKSLARFFPHLGELTSISANNEASSAPALCSAYRDLPARESSVCALQIVTFSQIFSQIIPQLRWQEKGSEKPTAQS